MARRCHRAPIHPSVAFLPSIALAKDGAKEGPPRYQQEVRPKGRVFVDNELVWDSKTGATEGCETRHEANSAEFG